MRQVVAEASYFQIVLEAAVPCLTVEWKPVTAPFDMRAALMHIHQVWQQVVLARHGRPLGLLGDTTHFAQLLPDIHELIVDWSAAMVAAGCRLMALVEPLSIPGQLSVDACIEQTHRICPSLITWGFADVVEARAWLTEQLQGLQAGTVVSGEAVGLPARP